MQGKVIDYDPPRKLSVTWQVEWPEEFSKLPECLVTYEIAPAGDGGAPDHDGIPFLGRAGGDPVRRPHGLAGGPVRASRACSKPASRRSIEMEPPKDMIEAIKKLK